ncbi:sensor histidine kinase [Rossellomorea marisflavi]|uniref:sensor histidine kinase n=1 Tax=Rossellomorea marisflavi TaxID=189381 RepID=UPI00207AA189|nr:HAMP domain-containing sensor histidine kinase [Rossellomorea marisflavi]USK92420.1 HAMP domain-containing histidine kinase [Rossellomorea marisflavi]
MRKEALSIKQWLLLFLLLFMVLPLLVTRGVVSLYEGWHASEAESFLPSLEPWVNEDILSKSDLWKDIGWQEEMEMEAEEKEVELKIFDGEDKLLFSNMKQGGSQGLSFLEEYPLMDGQERQGTVYVKDMRSPVMLERPSWLNYLVNEWGGGFIFLAVFALILLIGSRFIRKKILLPVKELKEAAELISTRQFHSQLPSTPVKELNDLSRSISAMQVRLEESMTRQAQMEEERKMFISSIIHDLRTPLFSIRGYLEGIQKGVADTPEKRMNYVDISHRKANVLNQLIDELHTYTKMNLLDANLSLQQVDMVDLAQELVTSLLPLAEEKDQVLSIRAEGDFITDVDPFLFSRALENIISNAIRYTPSHGEVTVTVSSSSIAVEDNGEGIPPHEIQSIFQPLYRGEHSRNRETGGSGLGLAIAKQIVERHGGQIEVESCMGKGSTFIIRL